MRPYQQRLPVRFLPCWHRLWHGGPKGQLGKPRGQPSPRQCRRSCRLRSLLLRTLRQHRWRKWLRRLSSPLPVRQVLLFIPLPPPNPLPRPARRLCRRWQASRRPRERTPRQLGCLQRDRPLPPPPLPLDQSSSDRRRRRRAPRSPTRTCEKFWRRSMTLRKPGKHA